MTQIVKRLPRHALTFSVRTISQPFGTNFIPSVEFSTPWQEGGQITRGLKLGQFADRVKIINVNVNGFRSKEAEIRRFIEGEGKNCIFALNDTRLRHSIKIAKIPGYSMIREDKTYNGVIATAGGVAFLIPHNWLVNFQIIGGVSSNLILQLFATVLFPEKKVSIPLGSVFSPWTKKIERAKIGKNAPFQKK